MHRLAVAAGWALQQAPNPEQADHGVAVRDQLVAQLGEMMPAPTYCPRPSGLSYAGGSPRCPGWAAPCASPPGGRLHIDRSAIRRETRLDGKWLLRCSDPSLSAEDVAADDKQLLEAGGTSRPTWACPRCTTARRSASAPTCCCAGCRHEAHGCVEEAE